MTSPTQRVYLHIGLPKTGTTSLQELLWHHREALTEDGVLYPGNDRATQHRAAMDVHSGRYGRWKERGTAGSWAWVVEQARAWPATTVISTELLAPAGPEEAARLLADLDFAEVHVVCTARDLARQIPSVWQENVKTRQTTSFVDFLGALTAPELNDTSRLFWDYQDLPRVLRTWGGNLPPERVHVVTVPPRGGASGLLWERFASVLGVDGSRYSTDVPHYNNFSLGMTETELLRRVNTALGDDVPWLRYADVVKDDFAATILAGRSGSTHIPLPDADHGWVATTAQRFREDLEGRGYDIVGDLGDLEPAPPSGKAADSHAATPDDLDVLDAAVDALAALLRREPEEPAAPTAAPAPPPPPGALRQRLVDFTERHPRTMIVRRLYWRAKATVRR
ncbi:hypothetical protein [Prauserella cavernicola]|uniref:Sulfotransferase family protein n=1 Tax=Prauserella cavernicola TaxID=2800127 RepID=A0A934V2K1_9PSEU|nr:hypothetical protein [Prauserella cavernicola]MBK1783027.1 hypothetical protein [Prauserella cavernicola]